MTSDAAGTAEGGLRHAVAVRIGRRETRYEAATARAADVLLDALGTSPHAPERDGEGGLALVRPNPHADADEPLRTDLGVLRAVAAYAGVEVLPLLDWD